MVHVFFDIGFTLMAGMPVSPARWIMEKFNIDPQLNDAIRDQVYCTNHETVESLIDGIEHVVGHSLFLSKKQVLKELWQKQYDLAAPIPGSQDLLITLASDDRYGLHIISNNWHPFYDAFKRVFSIHLPVFRITTLSHIVRLRKPDPEIFRCALSRAKAEPAASVMIGDYLSDDILPAMQLGMKTIWFAPPGVNRETDDVVPDSGFYKTTSLGQVKNILDQIEGNGGLK